MTVPIRVVPTSANSAESRESVVLWTSPNARRRLAFCFNIHNNPQEPDACISGELRYQSKRSADQFVDEPSLLLNELHAKQWTRYKLPSRAVLELYRVLRGLYKVHETRGVPRREYLLTPVDYREEESLPSADALGKLVAWLRRSGNPTELADALTGFDPDNVRFLNTASAVVALSALLQDWRQLEQSPEPDWHDLLLRHEWVVQQILGQPLILFQDEAVVSSSNVHRKKAAYVDFMYRNPHTAAIALVEIKVPRTPLLKDRPYRGEAYSPSEDLVAGVAQVQYYRATFQRDIKTLMRDTVYLELASPKSVLIIGDTATLDTDAKRSSFERFRSGVQDVQVIAFDELRSRVEGFLAVVTGEAFEESG